MISRPYKQAYATYNAYNVIDDFLSIFKPQTAEGIVVGGYSGWGGPWNLEAFYPGLKGASIEKVNLSGYLKQVGSVQKNTAIGEGAKRAIFNAADAPKRSCAKPCDAGYAIGLVPGTTDNCYCRQRGDVVHEALRVVDTIVGDFVEQILHPENFGHPQEVYAEQVKNCGYGNGKFCWSNKPCGKSSNVMRCIPGGNCSAARSRWLAEYGCKTGGGGSTPARLGSTPAGSQSGCVTACQKIRKPGYSMSPKQSGNKCLCNFKLAGTQSGCVSACKKIQKTGYSMSPKQSGDKCLCNFKYVGSQAGCVTACRKIKKSNQIMNPKQSGGRCLCNFQNCGTQSGCQSSCMRLGKSRYGLGNFRMSPKQTSCTNCSCNFQKTSSSGGGSGCGTQSGCQSACMKLGKSRYGLGNFRMNPKQTNCKTCLCNFSR